jgi:cysteinyl-tRNA synthetase
MDFSWEAMEDADRRVRQLRRHVADWAPAGEGLGEAASAFDVRFRDALAADLDLPAAVVVVNELDRSAVVPPGEKVALLASWDRVLGLDLDREARSVWAPSPDVLQLVARRDEARAARNYAESDRIREELQALGLEVMDTSEGTKVRPLA